MVNKSRVLGLGRKRFLGALAVPAIGAASLFCLENCATNSSPEIQRVKDSAKEISHPYNDFRKSLGNFKRQMNKALELSLEDSVRDTGLRGGYYFVPDPCIHYTSQNDSSAGVQIGERYIPIYLNKNGEHVPNIRDLEEGVNTSFGYAIMNNIPGLDGCMMTEEEIKEGVKINGLRVNFDTDKYKARSKISRKGIGINVILPTQMNTDERYAEMNEYNVDLKTDYLGLWGAALDITNAQAGHQGLLSDEEVANLVKGKNIKSKRSQIDKSPEGVIIYHLTSENISGNGVFSFAHDLRK